MSHPATPAVPPARSKAGQGTVRRSDSMVWIKSELECEYTGCEKYLHVASYWQARRSVENSSELLRTYSKEVRTVTNVSESGRGNPPVEASDSVLLNDLPEHLAGRYWCE